MHSMRWTNCLETLKAQIRYHHDPSVEIHFMRTKRWSCMWHSCWGIALKSHRSTSRLIKRVGQAPGCYPKQYLLKTLGLLQATIILGWHWQLLETWLEASVMLAKSIRSESSSMIILLDGTWRTNTSQLLLPSSWRAQAGTHSERILAPCLSGPRRRSQALGLDPVPKLWNRRRFNHGLRTSMG